MVGEFSHVVTYGREEPSLEGSCGRSSCFVVMIVFLDISPEFLRAYARVEHYCWSC